MNETFQAREGFSPDLFPPVHVFMGHYHKPHRVAGTDIRYIGSPYQGAHCNRDAPARGLGSIKSLEAALQVQVRVQILPVIVRH